MRLGIFGGSFNPIHNGHINSLVSLYKALGLNRLFVVPAAQNPLRPPVEGASPWHRLEMVQIALKETPFELDPFELEKGGLSFTINTLQRYHSRYRNWEVSLIIGIDQFLHFHQWKDYKTILCKNDLVITSRPGENLPQKSSEIPPIFRSFLAPPHTPTSSTYSMAYEVKLKTGRSLIFYPLEDRNISSTQIRDNLRKGVSVAEMIPSEVLEYIHHRKLYKSGDVDTDDSDFKVLTEFAARILCDKGGIQVRAFDVSHLDRPTEYYLIASGTSTRHTTALAEHMVMGLKKKWTVTPQGTEGELEGRWIALDYGSLIVHVFYDFVRWEYRLEELWQDGIEMEVKSHEN